MPYTTKIEEKKMQSSRQRENQTILNSFFVSLTLTIVLSVGCIAQASRSRTIMEFAIAYPTKSQTPVSLQGSTHEITYDEKGGDALWIIPSLSTRFRPATR
jgi:hypothetical protein